MPLRGKLQIESLPFCLEYGCHLSDLALPDTLLIGKEVNAVKFNR